MTREQFVHDTVAWINRRLAPPGAVIAQDTALFENGLIDSIRILTLIAWTEQAIGRQIPDAQIRMDYFRDVNTIAHRFVAAA